MPAGFGVHIAVLKSQIHSFVSPSDFPPALASFLSSNMYGVPTVDRAKKQSSMYL